jgi:hypothetical protein
VLARLLPLAVPSLAALLAAPLAARRAAAQPDTAWSALYRRDLDAARDVIANDHPGAVDRRNPAFARTLADAYDEAVRAADTVTSYAAYRIALTRFGNRFQDAHLNVGGRRPLDGVRDAGLFPVWRGGALVVADVDARYGAEADALRGATLVDCDGRRAADVLRDGILAWRGRAAIVADWYAWAPHLLVDYGPPTPPAPARCRVRPAGARPGDALATVALRWAPTDRAFAPRLARLAEMPPHPLGVQVRDGGREVWVDVPTFAVNGEGEIAAMRATVDSLRAELARNRAWEVVVFDLRGNGGGSSVWGAQMAAAVFGADWARQAGAWLGDGVYTEWRVSADNVKALRGQVEQQEQRHGKDSPAAAGARAFLDSMTAALARGDTLYAAQRLARRGVPRPAAAPVPGTVVLITSASCFSACLDFLDLMRLHPATVQVGQTTGVDTDYMENWGWPLPSGLSVIGYPMKVYRNRRRANNEAYVPDVPRDDLADQAALRAWVLAHHREWRPRR